MRRRRSLEQREAPVYMDAAGCRIERCVRVLAPGQGRSRVIGETCERRSGKRHRAEVDVRVRLPETLRQNPAQVADLKVSVPAGTGTKLIPLASLVTLDHYPLRRKASLEAGANASLDAGALDALEQLRRLQPAGADLVYEVSGSPAALDQAIAAAAYSGRVVVGSWYGKKQATLDLGGRFHRSRIRLLSSQVSSLAPELSGRWTKARRFELAWEMIRRVRPGRFITHRLPLSQAPEAYRLLDQSPEEAIQVVFEY